MQSLAKHPTEVQRQAVEYSISNEYAGLFPDRFAKAEKQKTKSLHASHKLVKPDPPIVRASAESIAAMKAGLKSINLEMKK